MSRSLIKYPGSSGGGGNFIINQNAAPQVGANFWIDGDGQVAGDFVIGNDLTVTGDGDVTGDFAIGGDLAVVGNVALGAAAWNPVIISPDNFGNFPVQIYGQITVEGANAVQVRFTGSNAFNPGFTFDGTVSHTHMYTFDSQNFSNQTSGNTFITGGWLEFRTGALIHNWQQPLVILRNYPNIAPFIGVIFDNAMEDIVPVVDTAYKIVQFNFAGSETGYVRGDGLGVFNGGILTGNPSGGTAKIIKFGDRVVTAVVADTTQYWEVEIDGNPYLIGMVSLP
jgi:hypothetical protein